MIAKQVPMRVAQKSSFSGLVKYITNAQEKNERVGEVSVTNCHQDEALDATLEILATQAQNKRAKADKTYHLIISFRAGENPSSEVLKAVEKTICDGLGFGEHQRISAVHHDTDNLHIHVAINKIHPTKLTIHAPYNDHKELGRLCEKLEIVHGLERDNHKINKRGAENKASDMEQSAGIESLLGWIKRGCLSEIKAANTWADLHDVLIKNGLEIRKRGNGLAINDRAGTTVKASSVSRELGMQQLEKRLGSYVAAIAGENRAESDRGQIEKTPLGPVGRSPPPKPLRRSKSVAGIPSVEIDSGSTNRYRREPMQSRIDTRDLFREYEATQRGNRHAWQALIASMRKERTEQIDGVKRTAKLKRSIIKAMWVHPLVKKALFSLVAKSLKADLDKIHAQQKERFELAISAQRQKSWADWLQQEASAGDEKALAALRARTASAPLRGDTVGGAAAEATQRPPSTLYRADTITKKGTVIYRVGGSAVRDDGANLQLSRSITQEGLTAALKIAMARYGERISVNGTEQFKEQVAQAAAKEKLKIVFTDPVVEARRQELKLSIEKRESEYVRTTGRSNQRTNERRTGAATVPGNGRATGSVRDPAAGRGRGGERRVSISASKSGIGRIGAWPPPPRPHTVRNVSQLNVVLLARGSEVLLPSDVHKQLDQQGADRVHSMRRDSYWARVTPEQGIAADKFIAERESKRISGFDIPNHKRYNGEAFSTATYAGTRQSNGHFLALLKIGSVISVMPVDEATARKLKKLTLGDGVSEVLKGAKNTKGRSR